ncbi:hypothetical protein DPMN_040971 [Dreissena polymorpha]|uniref:Uncharacterized protein n=1 Tax=Dreissena polymorpha TaxID=45954 RepID=A0A9D4CXW9_DREPO|nr:hypothetical protein DPMN_040971 [Dreissena polymorpha]
MPPANSGAPPEQYRRRPGATGADRSSAGFHLGTPGDNRGYAGTLQAFTGAIPATTGALPGLDRDKP